MNMRFKFILLFIILLSSCEYIEKSDYNTYDFRKEKTEFKEGKLYVKSKILNGELVVYNDENKIIQRKVYKDGIPVGDWSFYDDQGKLITEGNYICYDDEEEYFEFNKKRIFNYKGIPFNGVIYSNFENGNLGWSKTYKEGKKSGPYRDYFENGKLRTEENNLEGEKHGRIREYWENGRLKLEMFYTNGSKNGPVRHYYENGKISSEYVYKDGVQNGETKGYHYNGNIHYIGNYGNEDSTDLGTYRIGTWKWYYENGKDSLVINHRNRGDKYGTSYYPNGMKQVEYQYENGYRSGIWTWYFENGEIKSMEDYRGYEPSLVPAPLEDMETIVD